MDVHLKRTASARIVQILFLVCIALMLSAPLLLSGLNGPARSENRTLAAKPHVPESWQAALLWPRQMDSYINDHFGLRGRLIDLQTLVKWEVFHISPSPVVVAGRNGRLFFSEGDVPFRVLLGNCGAWWGDDNVDRFANDIAQTLPRVRQLSPTIPLIAVPTSDILYPADLPAWIAQKCQGKTPLVDQILQRLPTNLGSAILYPRAVALALPASASPFPKHSFHWDGVGVLDLLSRLVDEKWHWPRIASPRLMKQSKNPDLSIYYPGVDLSEPVTEMDWSGDAKICVETACSTRPPLSGIALPHQTARFSRKDNSRKLLILSDSFGWHAAEALLSYFDDIIVINLGNYSRLTLQDRTNLWGHLTEWHPDQVVFVVQDGNVTAIPRLMSGFDGVVP